MYYLLYIYVYIFFLFIYYIIIFKYSFCASLFIHFVEFNYVAQLSGVARGRLAVLCSALGRTLEGYTILTLI